VSGPGDAGRPISMNCPFFARHLSSLLCLVLVSILIQRVTFVNIIFFYERRVGAIVILSYYKYKPCLWGDVMRLKYFVGLFDWPNKTK
jgi:hypothetical protein